MILVFDRDLKTKKTGIPLGKKEFRLEKSRNSAQEFR